MWIVAANQWHCHPNFKVANLPRRKAAKSGKISGAVQTPRFYAATEFQIPHPSGGGAGIHFCH